MPTDPVIEFNEFGDLTTDMLKKIMVLIRPAR